MDPSGELNPNPIVAMAMRIRARRDVETAVDAGTPPPASAPGADAAAALAAFGVSLDTGARRLNSILGKGGVTFIRLEKPLRLRLRFKDKRVSLDLDEARQLVIVKGLDLDGEHQFDSASELPALINLSKLSTEPGYGTAVTPTTLLKTIAADAQLPRPAHLDEAGPMRF